MTDFRRWRVLVSGAVEQGASAFERMHLQAAQRPFQVLQQQFPSVSEPAQNIHEVHDCIVSGVYSAIRITNQLVSKTLDVWSEERARGAS